MTAAAPAGIMDDVADLIVVTGPPGAGKSTVAQVLSKLFDPSALVAGDDFFAFIDQGYIAPWTAEAHHQNEVVVGAAAAASGRLAVGGYTVVYDGVIGPWFLDTFGAVTGLERLHYAMLLPPERVCVERVRSRTGHGFTDLDAARHMYHEFANAEVAGRHVIKSGVAAEAAASSIFEMVLDGSLIRAIEGSSLRSS
ncbi:MAG: ATP-binding protein [Acidimicrobiales bacterium]